MKVKCDFCNNTFERDQRRINESIKRGWKQYCSSDCKSKARNNRIKCQCAHCGKEIWKLSSEIKSSKTGNVFCNKSCACSYNNSHFRTGENNPNWKGGIGVSTGKESVYGKLAFQNHPHRCNICGFDIKSALQVHHIDFNHKNNSIDNLMILCANCHCQIHYGDLVI